MARKRDTATLTVNVTGDSPAALLDRLAAIHQHLLGRYGLPTYTGMGGATIPLHIDGRKIGSVRVVTDS